ncbi:hypothetical protein HDU76_007922 [Blyttiomyces sp. JEL0837]|nr:hypothetical protein HDU76_007922 [Blyttiomyces sp. JEL0837]
MITNNNTLSFRSVMISSTTSTRSRFVYFSKSKDVEPGYGASERLSPNDIISKTTPPNQHPKDKRHIEVTTTKFTPLSKIPHWRRMLSNFWPSTFILDNHRYVSVEHHFHAFKLVHLHRGNISISDALNLLKDICEEPAKCKSFTSRKNLNTTSDRLREWDRSKWNVMKEGMRGKFLQNKELGKVLCLTGDAELRHFVRGGDGGGKNDEGEELCGTDGSGRILMQVREEVRMAWEEVEGEEE